MSIVLWCLVTAVVVPALVHWIQEQRRGTLDNELKAVRSAADAGESRLQDLNHQCAAQSENLKQTTAFTLELSKAHERLDVRKQFQLTNNKPLAAHRLPSSIAAVHAEVI